MAAYLEYLVLTFTSASSIFLSTAYWRFTKEIAIPALPVYYVAMTKFRLVAAVAVATKPAAKIK